MLSVRRHIHALALVFLFTQFNAVLFWNLFPLVLHMSQGIVCQLCYGGLVCIWSIRQFLDIENSIGLRCFYYLELFSFV